MKIDLHTHSNASDGTLSPASLMEQARKEGLEAIALTDHDTTAGLAEAGEAARDLGLDFIRGCEISASGGDIKMHILGLWLPVDSRLDNFLAALQEKRKTRNERMIAKLRALGFDINLEEVEAEAEISVGRPHFATILVKKGYAQNLDEAFAKYIGDKGLAYVPKNACSPEDAVRLLAGIGATVAIAHPLLSPNPLLEESVARLKEAGLDALEAWHSAQDWGKTRQLENLARKYDLGVSGGSDFHGEKKPAYRLGFVRDGAAIPGELLEKLKARRRAKGLPC